MLVDEEAPANYSLRAGADDQGFHFLSRGECVVLRTRDRDRLLDGLARHLGGHRPPPAGTVRTASVAVVLAGGTAVLLPDIGADLPRVERRLRHLGAAIVDAPWVDIDPAAGQLVVPEPHLRLDRSGVDGLRQLLPAGPTEAVVAPGPYPLAAWFFAGAGADGPLGRAEAVHRAFASLPVVSGSPRREDLVPLLGRLFSTVLSACVAARDPAAVIAAVRSAGNASGAMGG